MGCDVVFFNPQSNDEYLGSVRCERLDAVEYFCKSIGISEIQKRPQLLLLQKGEEFEKSKSEYLSKVSMDFIEWENTHFDFVMNLSVASMNKYRDKFDKSFYNLYFTKEWILQDFKESIEYILNKYKQGAYYYISV